ncbi:MAG: glycoside hydrolase family 5 protein [bacterium]|nr:glycoside hydrolase family 5 protein [bacterium]
MRVVQKCFVFFLFMSCIYLFSNGNVSLMEGSFYEEADEYPYIVGTGKIKYIVIPGPDKAGVSWSNFEEGDYYLYLQVRTSSFGQSLRQAYTVEVDGQQIPVEYSGWPEFISKKEGVTWGWIKSTFPVSLKNNSKVIIKGNTQWLMITSLMLKPTPTTLSKQKTLTDWSDVKPVRLPTFYGDEQRLAQEIEGVYITNDDKYIYILIDGYRGVKREENPMFVAYEKRKFVKGDSLSFHHTLYSWKIYLTTEELSDYTIYFSRDANNNISCSEKDVIFKEHPGYLEIGIPLTFINSPAVGIGIHSSMVGFTDENMANTEAGNFWPAGGQMYTYLVKGVISEKKEEIRDTGITCIVEDVEPRIAIIRWKSSVKTDAVIRYGKSPDRMDKTLTIEEKIKEGAFTLVYLEPAAEYYFEIEGQDYYGKTKKVKGSFTTPKAKEKKDDYWLRVKGSYVVDSEGYPYLIGAQNQVINIMNKEYRLEEEHFGTPVFYNHARYYRHLGLNTIRLAFNLFPFDRDKETSRDYYHLYGAEFFLEKVIAPAVQQVVDAGMYVVLDCHDYPKTTEEAQEMIAFWELIAKRFADEPRIAAYELWNEPNWPGLGLNPAAAEPLRKWYKEAISRIRKYDRRHIIIVADWNAAWGWATESQWAPINFTEGLDPECKQVLYNKHIAKDHTNEHFMAGGVDRVRKRYNIPFIFGEVEIGQRLMTEEGMRFFIEYLARSNCYGAMFWGGVYSVYNTASSYVHIWKNRRDCFSPPKWEPKTKDEISYYRKEPAGLKITPNAGTYQLAVHEGAVVENDRLVIKEEGKGGYFTIKINPGRYKIYIQARTRKTGPENYCLKINGEKVELVRDWTYEEIDTEGRVVFGYLSAGPLELSLDTTIEITGNYGTINCIIRNIWITPIIE